MKMFSFKVLFHYSKKFEVVDWLILILVKDFDVPNKDFHIRFDNYSMVFI